jgi:hypothetical protein
VQEADLDATTALNTALNAFNRPGPNNNAMVLWKGNNNNDDDKSTVLSSSNNNVRSPSSRCTSLICLVAGSGANSMLQQAVSRRLSGLSQ